jgi:hypothetical protein
MKNVEQITVFLENRSGRLADVAALLAEAGVNIRAASLADAADFGILRLIVNDTEKARQVLKEHGFTVSKTHVLAVAVPDQPGGLAQILAAIRNSRLNVEYMYAFVHKRAVDATIIFRFDDIDQALASLQSAGLRLLSGEEIYAS